jgi:four helix bundle protein
MGFEHMPGYRELKVWNMSMELAQEIYLLTENFPKREVYSLTDQIRRSVVSIPSNIAEGHERDTTKEYLRFLSISRGSLGELDTQLQLAVRLNYLDQYKFENLNDRLNHISRMIKNLQKTLRRKLNE